MDLTQDVMVTKKVSWGSIVGGVLTVMSISLMLSILGTSLGLAIVDPLGEDADNGASMTMLFWTGGSIVVSLAAGAFVAGRLAANDGFIHGFLVWATSLIITSILGAMLVGSAVKATGSAIGSLASASGSILSGAGSIAGSGIQEAGNLGGKIFEGLDIDTNVEPQKLQANVKEALRKSKIPSLQPEFVQQQLNGAKEDIASAVKQLATQPKDADAIIKNVMDKLQERGKSITKDVDRNTLTKALADNSDMTQDEINKAVDNIIEAKESADNLLNQKFEDVQKKIEDAKQQYDEFKQKALEQAAAAASALAKSAFWTFIALVIGAIISGFTGRLGAKSSRKHA